MIAVIAKMDLLYTVATSNLSSQENIIGEVVTSIILMVMAMIIGTALIVGKARKLCQWDSQIDDNIQKITKSRDNIISKEGGVTKEDIDKLEKEIQTWTDLPQIFSENKESWQDIKFFTFKQIEDGTVFKLLNDNIHMTLNTVRNSVITMTNPKDLININEQLIDDMNSLCYCLTSLRTRNFRWLITLMSIFIICSLICHTPGDNLEPLDNIPDFLCMGPNLNTTLTAMTCPNEEDSCTTNSIIRLGLAIGSLLSLVLAVIVYLRCSREQFNRYRPLSKTYLDELEEGRFPDHTNTREEIPGRPDDTKEMLRKDQEIPGISLNFNSQSGSESSFESSVHLRRPQSSLVT